MATIVTAYYQIPSKASPAIYHSWLKNMLKTIVTPMVIFGDDTSLPILKEARGILPAVFIRLPLNEFYMTRFQTYWIKDYQRDHERNVGHNPYLYMIWNEKPKFVQRAIDLNPFKTEWFVWCDIGCFRDSTTVTKYAHFPNTSKLDSTQFYLLNLNPFTDHERTIQPNGLPPSFQYLDRVGGGLLVGTRFSWTKFNQYYDEILAKFMALDRFCGKDQSIMATLAIMHPELVTLVSPAKDGDNPWFYLQRWLTLD